jgi:hypothetical protein
MVFQLSCKAGCARLDGSQALLKLQMSSSPQRRHCRCNAWPRCCSTCTAHQPPLGRGRAAGGPPRPRLVAAARGVLGAAWCAGPVCWCWAPARWPRPHRTPVARAAGGRSQHRPARWRKGLRRWAWSLQPHRRLRLPTPPPRAPRPAAGSRCGARRGGGGVGARVCWRWALVWLVRWGCCAWGAGRPGRRTSPVMAGPERGRPCRPCWRFRTGCRRWCPNGSRRRVR